jgi:hypothetical protein
MLRIEAFIDHTKGQFSLTGLAGTGSLNGMLLQPVSIGVFTVSFD